MNVKKFLCELVDGKILQQPIGLIHDTKKIPPTFTSGYFLGGTLRPCGDYTLQLDIGNGTMYRVGKNLIERNVNGYMFGKDCCSAFTNKEEFENRMNELMVEVKNRDNFPLFIRDLSLLKWNHDVESS